MPLEKVEAKKYILDDVEIGVLQFSIMLIKDLSLRNFSIPEPYPNFDNITEALKVVIENSNKKLDKNDYTGEFELKIEN